MNSPPSCECGIFITARRASLLDCLRREALTIYLHENVWINLFQSRFLHKGKKPRDAGENPQTDTQRKNSKIHTDIFWSLQCPINPGWKVPNRRHANILTIPHDPVVAREVIFRRVQFCGASHSHGRCTPARARYCDDEILQEWLAHCYEPSDPSLVPAHSQNRF